MAGKLIRRKELYEWVDGFQTDIQRKFDGYICSIMIIN